MTESTLTLLAQVLGPVSVFASLGLLANQGRLKDIIEHMLSNEPMLFIIHTSRMVLGLIILALLPDANHSDSLNMVFQWWGLLIALFGASGLLFPDIDIQLLKYTAKDLTIINTCLIIIFLIWLALTILGYL